MIDGLKLNKLLAGYRGKPAADRAALEATVLALAQFYLDHRARIEDIEINPLMVRPHGKGAVAVDVRVIWRKNNDRGRRVMEFELPEELRMFKDSLRRFVNNELIPIERQTLTAEGEEIKPEFLGKLQQRAKDLGIWMMEVPEEYGGPGLSLLQRTIVVEELSRTIALPARGEGITGPSVRHILFTLKGELQREISDAGAARREEGRLRADRARRRLRSRRHAHDRGADGDHYVINGTKRFITGANKAHFMQLMAATDRAKGSHGGISCFLVDMDTPGVKLGTSYQTMMGDRPWEIILDNVRVPASQPRRRGRQGLRAGAEMARRRPRQARRPRARRRRALPRNGDVLRQAALDLRPAARRPAGDPVEARAHVYRAAGGAAPGLQGGDAGSTPARTRARTATSASTTPTRWRSAPPTSACRSTAASGSPPTCRSRNSGASSAATASPKAPAK